MLSISLKDGLKTRLLIAKSGRNLRKFSESIGLSHCYLSQILNDKRNPSPESAFKIAKGLGLEIEDIFLINVVDASTDKKKVLVDGE